MKNKQAAKLKKKRRECKQAIKQAKIQKVLDSVNTYYKEHNMPVLSNKQAQIVYKKLKEVDNDVITKSAVASLLCTLYVLYKYYNYSTDELCNYSRRLQNFIKLVVEQGRSIRQLIEEIELDHNINFIDECKDLPRVANKDVDVLTTNEIRWKSTSDNYGYFLTLNVYILIMDFSWEHNQIKKFVKENKDVYLQILNNIEYRLVLKDILLKECSLDINLDTGSIINIKKGDCIT